MRDLLSEIYGNISRNKLRTCLTGFAVAWGIFMLIVLLGTGNGLRDSVKSQSQELATNTMSVYGGFTSKPYRGYQIGRRIELEEGDIALAKSGSFSSHIDQISRDITQSATLSYGKMTASATIEGTSAELVGMQKIDLRHGRFINVRDVEESRKVMVLPEKTALELLEGSGKAERMVGRMVRAGGVMFKVVGIVKSNSSMFGNTAYAPYTTVRTVWAKGKVIDGFTFTFHGLGTEAQNEAFTDELRKSLADRHDAAPDDKGAFWISNHFIQNMQMNKAFSLLDIGLFIVGLLTLLSGIVGVSNIMLISVKERTHEFGIRKAIGATPWSITRLIIAESVTVTALFGYAGMLLGMGACELIGHMLAGKSSTVLGETLQLDLNPTVSVGTAVAATLVLIASGTLAGLIPAVKAARTKPIEALRS